MDNTSQLFHIVLIDDELEICEALKEFLVKHSFQVTFYTHSKQALNNLEKDCPDLVITDYMMPIINGLELAKKIKAKLNIPIMMFTAVDDSKEKIQALESNIDDYLVKPFNLRVLLARIKSLLRRYRFNKQHTPEKSNMTNDNNDTNHYTVFTFSELTLNIKQRLLTDNNNNQIPLGSAEFEILEVLVKNPQKILSRDKILAETHKVSFGADDRRIDVHISRLRQKLENSIKNSDLIKTVRGKGYLFTANVLGKSK